MVLLDLLLHELDHVLINGGLQVECERLQLSKRDQITSVLDRQTQSILSSLVNPEFHLRANKRQCAVTLDLACEIYEIGDTGEDVFLSLGGVREDGLEMLALVLVRIDDLSDFDAGSFPACHIVLEQLQNVVERLKLF